VHFTGRNCDMEEISKVAQKLRPRVVEVAIYTTGGNYPSGEKIGSCKHSDLTVFPNMP
jgi:hypothetical protein